MPAPPGQDQPPQPRQDPPGGSCSHISQDPYTSFQAFAPSMPRPGVPRVPIHVATSSPRPSPIPQPSLAKRGPQSSLLLLLLWPSPGDTGPSQAVILLWGGGLAYLISYLTLRGWGWQSIACGYELGVSPSSTTLWLPRVSQRVLTQVISAPKGHWVMSGTSLVIMTRGGGGAPGFEWVGPGRLLHTPQSPGWPHRG